MKESEERRRGGGGRRAEKNPPRSRGLFSHGAPRLACARALRKRVALVPSVPAQLPLAPSASPAPGDGSTWNTPLLALSSRGVAGNAAPEPVREDRTLPDLEHYQEPRIYVTNPRVLCLLS